MKVSIAQREAPSSGVRDEETERRDKSVVVHRPELSLMAINDRTADRPPNRSGEAASWEISMGGRPERLGLLELR